MLSKRKERNNIKFDNWIYIFNIPLLILSVIALLFFTFSKLESLMNSDTAAEILLGREILIEKNIFPSGWFYSTEIRVLNIHLLLAPILKLTGNMMLSKSISNSILILLFIVAYVLLMKSMKIKKTYTLFMLPIILTPLSLTMLDMLFAGAFYVPYLTCIMLVITMLNYLNNEKLRKSKVLILSVISIFLGFLLGMTGTRFLTNLYIPLVISEIFIVWIDIKEKNEINIRSKELWIKILFSCSSAFASFCGFLFNRLVLVRTLKYAEFGNQDFAPIESLSQRISIAVGTIFKLFGGVASGRLMSVDGVITVGKFTFTIVAFVMAFKLLKDVFKLSRVRRGLIIFFWVSFVLNMYLLIFTNMEVADRYHINIIFFIFPIIAVYYDEYTSWLESPIRLLSIFLIFFCVVTSQYGIMYKNAFKVNGNKDKYELIEYLKDNDLKFGYATFWNADVMTVLSNGDIEVANLDYSIDKIPYWWLTPKRLYSSDNNPGQTFLLLTKEESEKATKNLLEGSEKIKEINGFIIYRYEKNPFDFN